VNILPEIGSNDGKRLKFDVKRRKMKENLQNDAQNRESLQMMPKKGNQLDFLVKMWYNVRG
jgi:hypothetical protein